VRRKAPRAVIGRKRYSRMMASMLRALSIRPTRAGILGSLLLLPLLFCACAGARPAGPAAGGPDVEAVADNAALAIAAALTPPLALCPERVWPGLPGRDLQVLLVDFQGRRALLWNDLREGYRERPRISAVPFEGLPPLFTSGSEYQFGKLYGKPALGFAYDPKADPSGSAEVIVHEEFHRYQGGWREAGAGMSRGIRYPEPWGPRYLRRELIRSLRAVVEGKPGALSDASAWLYRLREEFPEALREARAVDVIEGTAEYAGVMAAAVAASGCEAEDPTRIAKALMRVAGRWDRPDKEEESYALGVLAGLALRARGAKEWEAAAAAGAPPAELLLSAVPPGDPAGDVELAAETKRDFAAANRTVREKIDPFLSPTPGDVLLVAAPSAWIQGSFETRGFVTLPGDGGAERTFVLDMAASFASPEYGSRLSLSGVTVERSGSPCGGGEYHVFPLPIRALREGPDGRGAIAEDRVRGEALAYDFVRLSGVVWLCLR